MTQSTADYHWTKHPEATGLIVSAMETALEASSWLRKFSEECYRSAGTRLLDWIDRIVVPAEEEALQRLGFSRVEVSSNLPSTLEQSHIPNLWRQPQAKLPDVISHHALSSESNSFLAIKTESLVDFLVSQQKSDADTSILGRPGSAMRRALIESEGQWDIWAIERHGGWHWSPVAPPELSQLAEVSQSFRLRPRNLGEDDRGFDD